MMDHKALLKRLGGEHKVCAALNEKGVEVSAVAVRAWALTDRAIPAKYWAVLKEIADDAGIPVSYEELAESVRKDAA